MIRMGAVLPSLHRSVDRARHHARRPVARLPYLWDAAMRVRPEKRATLAHRGTALVIEGYLRCGNTFSVAAFQIANGPELHVGRHLHGAPHVLRAVRLGLPTVVLVREPEDAVLEYLDFYRTAWPARDGFVIAPFERVTTDFGGIIDEVNARFGTSFRRFEHTPDNEARAFRLVEDMNRLESGGQVVETHVGRPSGQRDGRKAELRQLLAHPRTAARLQQAREVYQRYLALAAERAA